MIFEPETWLRLVVGVGVALLVLTLLVPREPTDRQGP